MSEQKDEATWLREKLAAEVNSHGYAFQYAVVAELQRLYAARESNWVVSLCEVPVPSRPNGTRIDILARHVRHPIWLAIECKRVNPSHHDWVFFTSPHAPAGATLREGYTEAVHAHQYHSPTTQRSTHSLHMETVHVGLEVGGKVKGEGAAAGRGAIEDALGQAVKGANGLMTYFAQSRGLLEMGSKATVVPVLFTTASIWRSEASLARASLADGRLDLEESSLRRVGAVPFNYHTSPMIRSEVPIGGAPSELNERVAQEFFKTVVIANGESAREAISLVGWVTGLGAEA